MLARKLKTQSVDRDFELAQAVGREMHRIMEPYTKDTNTWFLVDASAQALRDSVLDNHEDHIRAEDLRDLSQATIRRIAIMQLQLAVDKKQVEENIRKIFKTAKWYQKCQCWVELIIYRMFMSRVRNIVQKLK